MKPTAKKYVLSTAASTRTLKRKHDEFDVPAASTATSDLGVETAVDVSAASTATSHVGVETAVDSPAPEKPVHKRATKRRSVDDYLNDIAENSDDIDQVRKAYSTLLVKEKVKSRKEKAKSDYFQFALEEEKVKSDFLMGQLEEESAKSKEQKATEARLRKERDHERKQAQGWKDKYNSK